jgi:hypothetical protein
MWVWDSAMPGALVVDEMGLVKTFPSVTAVMICILLTYKVVMGLQLSTLWENTVEVWVYLAKKNFPGIKGDKQEWYLLRRQLLVPSCLSEIQSTSPQGHSVLPSAFEPILVVIMPSVAEMFKSVIDEMTY